MSEKIVLIEILAYNIATTVTAGLTSTSTTTLTPSLANKTFTTQSGKSYAVDQFLKVYSAATPAISMYGQVKSYSGTTLVLESQIIGTASAASDWTIEASPVETLRYCDGLAYRTRPSEIPANALYRPFILDPGWTRQDIFTKPGSYGHTTPGEVILDDSSGTLGSTLIENALTSGYAFDGRSIIIRIGTRAAAYPSGYTVILNGSIEGQPKYSWGKISLHPVDLTSALKVPLQSQRYAGNNVAPNGFEGGDDLKGKAKPLVIGYANNMQPVLVNDGKLIYQSSCGFGGIAVSGTNIRDKGVPLTNGGTYSNRMDMLNDSLAPSAGNFKYYVDSTDGFYFRLGSSPFGQVTHDAVYNSGTAITHAQCWQRLLLAYGIPAANISASDVTALDTALPGPIDCAFFNDTDYFTELTRIATSAGASWYGDENGVHRIVQWAAPSGSAVASINELRIDTIDIADAVGTGDGAPAYLITGGFGKNWTTQQDSALGGDKTSPTDAVRASGSLAGLPARVWLSTDTHPVQSPSNSNALQIFRGPFAGSSSGSITVSTPSDIADGDLMLALVSMSAVSAPAGWTLVTSITPTSGALLSIYKRIASSEPASYVWTGSAIASFASITYFKNNSSTGINQTGSWYTRSSGTILVAPSVTTTMPNGILLQISMSALVSAVNYFTIATGMVRLAPIGNNGGPFAYVDYANLNLVGATGAFDLQMVDGSVGGVSILLAIEHLTPVPSTVSLAHKNAIEIKIASMLTNRSDAQTYSDAQLTLYGTPHRMITVSAWLSDAQIALLRVGSIITLTEAHWGMSAGRSMRVAGVKIDRGTGKTELNIWG